MLVVMEEFEVGACVGMGGDWGVRKSVFRRYWRSWSGVLMGKYRRRWVGEGGGRWVRKMV